MIVKTLKRINIVSGFLLVIIWILLNNDIFYRLAVIFLLVTLVMDELFDTYTIKREENKK